MKSMSTRNQGDAISLQQFSLPKLKPGHFPVKLTVKESNLPHLCITGIGFSLEPNTVWSEIYYTVVSE